MKKVFCMVMALVLLLPINSLGFEGRADDEVNMQSCSHSQLTLVSTSVVSYEQFSSSAHKVNARKKYRCNSCGAITFVPTTYYESHDCNTKGSCNGATTTVDYICDYCNCLTQRITYPCRGASCIYPHDTINGTHAPDFCCDHHSHD